MERPQIIVDVNLLVPVVALTAIAIVALIENNDAELVKIIAGIVGGWVARSAVKA